MIELICYLFPAIISVDYSKKRNTWILKDRFVYLMVYVKWVMVNIFFSYLLLFFFSDYKGSTVFVYKVSFVLQYLTTSVVLAFIMPRIYYFIKENFSIKLNARRIKKDED